MQDDDDVNIMQDEFCEKKDIEYIEMQEITKSQNLTKSNNFMNQLNSAYNQSQAKYQN